MKTLALYNLKGGVGKTSAAVNLAWNAAHEGYRTLLWDLDPQGAATFYFRIKPKVKGGAKKLFRKKHQLEDQIKASDFENLDVVPADLSYRHNDVIFEAKRGRTKQVRRMLKPFAGSFDYVFLDCPPTISLVSENIFEAADALIVPVIPTTLSLRTLEQVVSFLDKAGLDLPVYPFFSMVDARKKLHKNVMAWLPEERPDMLRTIIPYASEVEQMGTRRTAVACYARGSRSARAYQNLWHEIRGRFEPSANGHLPGSGA